VSLRFTLQAGQQAHSSHFTTLVASIDTNHALPALCCPVLHAAHVLQVPLLVVTFFIGMLITSPPYEKDPRLPQLCGYILTHSLVSQMH
jgi:hypothetical protein